MAQTYGSQIIGPWYDVLVWVLGSVFFYYFAFTAKSLPLSAKSKRPAFFMNAKLCISVGTIMAALGIYKAIEVSSAASKAPTSQPGWLKIHSNEKGDSIFIDSNRISRNGALVDYWSKLTFKAPRAVGQNLKASTLIDEYVADCSSMTLVHMQSTGLSDSGETINFQLTTTDKNAAPIPSDAGHPDAILFRYVCAS